MSERLKINDDGSLSSPLNTLYLGIYGNCNMWLAYKETHISGDVCHKS